MTGFDAKADLHEYLRGARETLLWKLDGLGEYDIRRPLTPTGTNLLGLVKHQASGEFMYFGDVFGRPHGERLPWREDGAEPNADMWAAPDETRDCLTGLYRRAWQHADATIAELPLDATATVPWWGEGGTVTLGRILVHMTAETQRHAGHADIVREMIDGSVGLLKESDNMSSDDPAWWRDYRDQVEQAAKAAG
ncbi:MAG TPA: DinB family protein [Trebonia sp.]